MKKGLLIGLIVLALIILFVVITRASSGPMATLLINKGTVQVDKGLGWTDATNGMIMKEGYKVQTLAGSRATVVFMESTVIRLNENTEITLKNINKTSVSLIQQIGQTWTKMLKMSGISDYEIETPDAVATVRGTAFAVTVQNGTSEIGVSEGVVKTDSYKIENGVHQIVASLDVGANRSLEVSSDNLGTLETKPLQMDSWIEENNQADQDYLKLLKQQLLQKYSTRISIARTLVQISDEDMNNFVNDFVEGRLSIKEKLANGDIPSIISPLIPEELKRY